MYHKPGGMERARENMVMHLMDQGIRSERILNIMNAVPRHLFVSEALRYRAYDNSSLPIGFGQTVSKPFVIALMVQALELAGSERILEIGTGSGYQTAILSSLSAEVVSLERIEELSRRAKALLMRLGVRNCTLLHEDDFNRTSGTFDAIIVAAGAEIMPGELILKLRKGGRLIIPVADKKGHIIRKYKILDDGTCLVDDLAEAFFVPLILNDSKAV